MNYPLTSPLAQRTLVEHFTFEGWLPNDFHDQRRYERCKVSGRIRQERDGWMGTETEHWTGVAINLHQQAKSAAAVTVTDPSLCMRSLGSTPTPLAVCWPLTLKRACLLITYLVHSVNYHVRLLITSKNNQVSLLVWDLWFTITMCHHGRGLRVRWLLTINSTLCYLLHIWCWIKLACTVVIVAQVSCKHMVLHSWKKSNSAAAVLGTMTLCNFISFCRWQQWHCWCPYCAGNDILHRCTQLV